MARLYIKTGARRGHSIELQPGPNLVGREPGAGHVLDDPTVSSRHCVIVVDGDAVRVRDLGSTNGTFVDEQPVQEAELASGQVLRLGAVELVLETAQSRISVPEREWTAPGPPPPLPDGSSACQNHPDRRASHRCPQCDQHFCPDCLHVLRRTGGRMLILCPVCSAPCEAVVALTSQNRKRALWRGLKRWLLRPARRR